MGSRLAPCAQVPHDRNSPEPRPRRVGGALVPGPPGRPDGRRDARPGALAWLALHAHGARGPGAARAHPDPHPRRAQRRLLRPRPGPLERPARGTARHLGQRPGPLVSGGDRGRNGGRAPGPDLGGPSPRAAGLGRQSDHRPDQALRPSGAGLPRPRRPGGPADGTACAPPARPACRRRGPGAQPRAGPHQPAPARAPGAGPVRAGQGLGDRCADRGRPHRHLPPGSHRGCLAR